MESQQAFLDLFLGDHFGFKAYSLWHFLPVLFFGILSYIWIKTAQKWDESYQYKNAFWFSVSLAFSVFIWMFYKIVTGRFNPAEDLPFHLCNILTFALPIAIYYKSRWFFGILYFWVLAGTIQAILTPELKEAFPHYIYFRYWYVHCGLVMLIFYGLFVFRWHVYRKDLINALFATNVYLIFSFIGNFFSGGNYFYSMHKPKTASLLDYLGPWPIYLITGQVVMAILFVLVFLPFMLKGKTKRSIELYKHKRGL